VLKLNGTTLFNFFDFTLISPLYQRLGVLGEANGEAVSNRIRNSSLKFFDVHLNGNVARLKLKEENDAGLEFLERSRTRN
jgi:hypothetical protein